MTEVIYGFETTVDEVIVVVEISDAKEVRTPKLFLRFSIEEMFLFLWKWVIGVRRKIFVAIWLAALWFRMSFFPFVKQDLKFQQMVLEKDPGRQLYAIVDEFDTMISGKIRSENARKRVLQHGAW